MACIELAELGEGVFVIGGVVVDVAQGAVLLTAVEVEQGVVLSTGVQGEYAAGGLAAEHSRHCAGASTFADRKSVV